MDCSLPHSSVHGILQARILEWVDMPSSRGSSWPRDQTLTSLYLLYQQVGSLPLAPPGKPQTPQHSGQKVHFQVILMPFSITGTAHQQIQQTAWSKASVAWPLLSHSSHGSHAISLIVKYAWPSESQHLCLFCLEFFPNFWKPHTLLPWSSLRTSDSLHSTAFITAGLRFVYLLTWWFLASSSWFLSYPLE